MLYHMSFHLFVFIWKIKQITCNRIKSQKFSAYPLNYNLLTFYQKVKRIFRNTVFRNYDYISIIEILKCNYKKKKQTRFFKEELIHREIIIIHKY